MLFNSFTFLAFFLCVLTLHALPLPWKLRKLNLLVASYVYYAAWNVKFPLLLVYATVTNLIAAKWIARWHDCPGRRRFVLWLNVSLNIGLLCTFKYGNEFFEAWNAVARQLNPSAEFGMMRLLLPVGLSFFTFQSLSYTIDVYRRQIEPATSALDLALFVSFFPVLLAGPLLRAGDFLPQCARPRRVTLNEVGMGAALITLGLFMKITLADHVLLPVAWAFGCPTTSERRLPPWGFAIFGSAGISRWSRGCVTMCSFRWAASTRATVAPRSTY